MRFPEGRMSLEAALPWSDSVHSWLGHQLELRGIDSIIYTRYVITLLQQDVSELEHSEREDLWERRVEAKRNRDKKEGKKKSSSVITEEDKRKTAAVECLLSVSDEETDIENLVDELCARLKETSCEREYFAPLSININDTADDTTEIKTAESQDPAERYYAAFPALPGESSPQTMSPSLDEDNVWRRNPFTGILAGDTYESKDKNHKDNIKKSTLVPEKLPQNNKLIPHTKLRDEKENHHPQPKVRHQRKASPGGSKLKQIAKKGNNNGKNRKGSRFLSWPLPTQHASKANESPSNGENKLGPVDPKEEEYCNLVENMLKNLLLGEKEKHGYSRMEKYFPQINCNYSSIPEWYEEDIYNSEFLENDDWYTKPLESIFATPISKAQRLYKRHSYPSAVFSCSDRLNWEDLFKHPILYLEKPQEVDCGIDQEDKTEDKNKSNEVIKPVVECPVMLPVSNVEVCQTEQINKSRSQMEVMQRFPLHVSSDVTNTVQSLPTLCVHSDTTNNVPNTQSFSTHPKDGTEKQCSEMETQIENDCIMSCGLLLLEDSEENKNDDIEELLKSVENQWDAFAVSNDARSTVSELDKGCFSDTANASPCITDVSQKVSPFPDMLLLLNYVEDGRSESGIHTIGYEENNKFASLVDMQNVFGKDKTDFEYNIPSVRDLQKDCLSNNEPSCSFSESLGSTVTMNTPGIYQEADTQLDCMASKLRKETFPFNVHTCSLSEDTDSSGESFIDIKSILEINSSHASTVSFNLESDDEDVFVESKSHDRRVLSSKAININRREDYDEESACFPTDLLNSFGSVGECSGNSDCLLFGLPQLVDTSYLLDLFGLGEACPRVTRSPAFLFHLSPRSEGGSSCWPNRVFLDEFECSLSFEEFCKSSPRKFWDDMLKNEASNVESLKSQQNKPLYHLWDVNSNKKVTQFSDNNIWNSILSLFSLTPEYTIGDDAFTTQSPEMADIPNLEDSALDLQFLEELNENRCCQYDRELFEGNMQKCWHNSWTYESIDSSFRNSYGFAPSKNSAFMGVVPRTFHHVQSAPNLTYRRLLSPFLSTDNYEKACTPPNSPTEHLYFSSKTHFRPIQTPVGTPDAEYKPNDLFGGADVNTDSPYQQFRDVTDEQELKFRPKFKILKYLDKYIQTGSSLDESNMPSLEKAPVDYDKKEVKILSEADLPDKSWGLADKENETGSISDYAKETNSDNNQKDEMLLSVPPGFEKMSSYESSLAEDKEKSKTDSSSLTGSNGIDRSGVCHSSNWIEDLTDSSESFENLESENSETVSVTETEDSDSVTEKNGKGNQNLSIWNYTQQSEGENFWLPVEPSIDKAESADNKLKPDCKTGSIWNMPSSQNESAIHCMPFVTWAVESDYDGDIKSIWSPPVSCASPDHLVWESQLGQVSVTSVDNPSVWAIKENSDKNTTLETSSLKNIWDSDQKTPESVKCPQDEDSYDPFSGNDKSGHIWSTGYDKLCENNEQNMFFLTPNKEEISPNRHCYQSDTMSSNMYYTEGEGMNPSERQDFCDDTETENIRQCSDDLYNYYLQNYPEMESCVLSSDLEESSEPKDYDFGSLVPIPQQAVFSSDLEKQWLDNKSQSVIDNRRRSHKNKIVKGGNRKPCSFFLDGNCRRSDCKFSHDISNITCRFWEVGQCFKGTLCPFLHGYPSDVSSSSPEIQTELTKEDFPELEHSTRSLVKPVIRQKIVRKNNVRKDLLKKEAAVRKEHSSLKRDVTPALGSVH